MGSISESCLSDLRSSFCSNHVDFAFISDHPNNFEYHEIPELLSLKTGDALINNSGTATANQMSPCSDNFSPVYTVGFENNKGLMALGMNQHLDASQSVRDSLYNQQSLTVRNQLYEQAGALVVIPHTESQTVSAIEAIQPDAIEIYNIHANIDPKIRLNYLGLSPFGGISKVAAYSMDPYHQLNSDFAFFAFFKISQIYFNIWDQLIADNYHVTGLVGTDAHENIPGLYDSSGERLDSHRRLVRFISNYVLLKTMTVDSVKDAIRSGQTSLVVEGISVPSGMDFFGNEGTTIVEIGHTASLASSNGSVMLTAKMPSIQGGVPAGTQSPGIRMELRKVQPGGSDQVVASSSSGDLVYNATSAGAYRLQVYIVPRHLKIYLGGLFSQADSEYTWIVTNHIFVTS